MTLRLHCHSGAELLVSYSCLGADLDPCRLRATLLHERVSGVQRLDAAVTRVEIVAGVRPLGIGLYERHTADADERWFVTTLAAEQVAAALADGPDHFHTVIKPDPELGVNAVCIRPLAAPAHQVNAAELDEAAVWAVSAALAAEVATELGALTHPARIDTSRPAPSKPTPRKEHP
ncbi:MAG TPA: hypothetical protein VNQ73_15075 [Ilumatobacter sp.]|nr:hypothetical protein [Ilumatobacter sp.]